MKAASGEFALAALLVVAGVLFAVFDEAVLGGLICLCAVALGYLGHRRGVLEIMKEKDLEAIASEDRRLQVLHPHVQVPQIAEEVKASGNAKCHWEVERGKDRKPATVPPDVDPFEYIVYRHTRSATVAPSDPALPPLRHFIDLREAALISTDRATLVELISEHIKRSFPQYEAYTGVLIPRSGNVALGLAVATALELEPVLVRDEPLFGKSTESVLTAGLLILVDDVWSDGGALRRAVELARFDNYSVADAVLIVARSEGSVEADLEASHVTLEPLFRLSDENIDSILERVARLVD